MPPEVARNDAEHRYEVRRDGAVAGYTQFRARPGVIAFIHTVVDAPPRLLRTSTDKLTVVFSSANVCSQVPVPSRDS
jgi:hypothetical protein